MNTLNIVNRHLAYPEVILKKPTNSSYILLAMEIDQSHLPVHLRESKKKKDVINHAKTLCQSLRSIAGVHEATVFKALITAPGRGAFLSKRQGNTHIAKYDVVILVETEDALVTKQLLANDTLRAALTYFNKNASYTYLTQATNIKRIDSVNHARQGIFLFNYFFADDIEQNIKIWHYTAGYFQKETGLNNSTVLLPLERGEANYSIINHCRWNTLADILPTLLFKKSFHSYVLENFEANNTAAMPILYKLA